MSDAARQPFVQRFLGAVPHLHALGIDYVAHGSDWAELALPYAAALVAYPETGVLASGAIFSLLDTAGGFAVSVRTAALGHATLDLRLDYLRAAEPHITVTGRAECYRLTKRVAFVRGVAHQGDPARPVANMVGTFMLGVGS